MWTVVYITQDKDAADRLRSVLENNSIIVRIRSIIKEENKCGSCYEVMVPNTEMDAAQNLIIDNEF